MKHGGEVVFLAYVLVRVKRNFIYSSQPITADRELAFLLGDWCLFLHKWHRKRKLAH